MKRVCLTGFEGFRMDVDKKKKSKGDKRIA